MEQETSRHGNPGFWLFNRFLSLGWTSPNMKNMVKISEFIMKNHFFRNCFIKTFPADWRVLTWQRQNELIMPYWQAMEDNYEAQIRRVKVKLVGFVIFIDYRISFAIDWHTLKEIVPEDRLLIWNLKDGWEPLCKFLGKPIPNTPIPVVFINFFFWQNSAR